MPGIPHNEEFQTAWKVDLGKLKEAGDFFSSHKCSFHALLTSTDKLLRLQRRDISRPFLLSVCLVSKRKTIPMKTER